MCSYKEKVNYKRVCRVYKAAGLSVKRTRRKKLIRSLRPALQLHAANQEWAIDFVSDVSAGRSFRVLSGVDSFTRECLPLEVDTSMGRQRLTRVLDRIIQQRGLPLAIRSDNGPDLTSRHFLAWSIESKVDLIHIQPGRPIQNAHVESFHGRLRDECLNVSWFWNLFDARRRIESWRKDYNGHRPHSSLGYRTPEEFARQVAPSPSASSGSAPLDSPQGQALRAATPALTQVQLRAQTVHQEGEAALHCGSDSAKLVTNFGGRPRCRLDSSTCPRFLFLHRAESEDNVPGKSDSAWYKEPSFDRDAHASCTLVAKSQDSFTIAEHDAFHIVVARMTQDLINTILIRITDK